MLDAHSKGMTLAVPDNTYTVASTCTSSIQINHTVTVYFHEVRSFQQQSCMTSLTVLCIARLHGDCIDWVLGSQSGASRRREN